MSISYDRKPISNSIAIKANRVESGLIDDIEKVIYYSPNSEDGVSTLIDTNLFPCPNSKSRECIYVAGRSGSGKTTFATNYCEIFQTMFPDKKVFWFSSHDNVPKNVIKVRHDDILAMSDNEYTIKDFEEGSLIVFDDCDSGFKNNILNSIWNLQSSILQTGRHKNLYCMILSHILVPIERIKSSIIFEEIKALVLFPTGGNKEKMSTVLEKKFSIDKKDVKRILSKGKFLYISVQHPLYSITDTTISLL